MPALADKPAAHWRFRGGGVGRRRAVRAAADGRRVGSAFFHGAPRGPGARGLRGRRTARKRRRLGHDRRSQRRHGGDDAAERRQRRLDARGGRDPRTGRRRRGADARQSRWDAARGGDQQRWARLRRRRGDDRRSGHAMGRHHGAVVRTGRAPGGGGHGRVRQPVVVAGQHGLRQRHVRASVVYNAALWIRRRPVGSSRGGRRPGRPRPGCAGSGT